MRSLAGTLSILLLLSACTGPPALSKLRLTYVGSYESIRGAGDPLGCVCPAGGYLTSCGGQRIPLCFAIELPPVDCRSLEVRGRYRNTPPDSPCPEGVFRYLLVDEWRCLD